MRRLLLLGALPLLFGAGPLPTVEPPAPLLGRPCTVVIPLPEPETTLAGLPALGGFELLLPPQQDGSTLRLVLLPLRPGPQTLPALTLQTSMGIAATVALPVTVVDDLPAELTPAPLLRHPSPSAPGRWAWALLPLLVLAVLACLLLRRRARPQPPTRDEQLAALALRLAERPGTIETQTLLAEIERVRFAPVTPSADALTSLLERGLQLLREGA